MDSPSRVPRIALASLLKARRCASTFISTLRSEGVVADIAANLQSELESLFQLLHENIVFVSDEEDLSPPTLAIDKLLTTKIGDNENHVREVAAALDALLYKLRATAADDRFYLDCFERGFVLSSKSREVLRSLFALSRTSCSSSSSSSSSSSITMSATAGGGVVSVGDGVKSAHEDTIATNNINICSSASARTNTLSSARTNTQSDESYPFSRNASASSSASSSSSSSDIGGREGDDVDA